MLNADHARQPFGEGDILEGKYRIERLLGEGGMGTVLAARHVALGHGVAIKLMLPEAMRSPGAAERFLREARAAAALRSDHVVRVHDIGQLRSGVPFMVLELLEGSDLGTVIEERGGLPAAEAVEYVLQACEAVAEAHAHGIIHRDLKPRNLFLTRRSNGAPLIKVLDFGISKVIAPGFDGQLTRSSDIVGSPAYMAPEQIRDARAVDARTDIWALGSILFQLLTARLPFDANTLPQLCAMVLEHPVPRVSEFRGDVPPALEGIVDRCMRKEPAERFATVGELTEALAPFAPMGDQHLPAALQRTMPSRPPAGATASALAESSPARLRGAPPAAAQEGTLNPLGTTHAPGPKRRWPAIAVVLTVTAVFAAGIMAWRGTNSVLATSAQGSASADAGESASASAPPTEIPAPSAPIASEAPWADASTTASGAAGTAAPPGQSGRPWVKSVDSTAPDGPAASTAPGDGSGLPSRRK